MVVRRDVLILGLEPGSRVLFRLSIAVSISPSLAF